MNMLRGSDKSFYDLGLEIPDCHFCHINLARQVPKLIQTQRRGIRRVRFNFSKEGVIRN